MPWTAHSRLCIDSAPRSTSSHSARDMRCGPSAAARCRRHASCQLRCGCIQLLTGSCLAKELDREVPLAPELRARVRRESCGLTPAPRPAPAASSHVAGGVAATSTCSRGTPVLWLCTLSLALSIVSCVMSLSAQMTESAWIASSPALAAPTLPAHSRASSRRSAMALACAISTAPCAAADPAAPATGRRACRDRNAAHCSRKQHACCAAAPGASPAASSDRTKASRHASTVRYSSRICAGVRLSTAAAGFLARRTSGCVAPASSAERGGKTADWPTIGAGAAVSGATHSRTSHSPPVRSSPDISPRAVRPTACHPPLETARVAGHERSAKKTRAVFFFQVLGQLLFMTRGFEPEGTRLSERGPQRGRGGWGANRAEKRCAAGMVIRRR